MHNIGDTSEMEGPEYEQKQCLTPNTYNVLRITEGGSEDMQKGRRRRRRQGRREKNKRRETRKEYCLKSL